MQLFDFEDSRRKFALVGCSSLPYIPIPFHDANLRCYLASAQQTNIESRLIAR